MKMNRRQICFKSFGFLVAAIALSFAIKMIGSSSEEGLGGDAASMIEESSSHQPQVLMTPAVLEELEEIDSKVALFDQRDKPEFGNEEKLNHLSKLAQKIYRSETDQQKMKEALSDVNFLSELGVHLVRPAKSLDERKLQNVSLKLLLQAERKLALQVVEKVVSNKSVEDNEVPLEDRKELAGIKGELIYEWTSAYPEDSVILTGWLPGPVSQKIWTRVQRLQSSNLALSN